jgi:hypothetical protein
MEKHVAGCGGCARACDALKEALHACRTTPSRDVPAHVQQRVKTAVEAWLQERGES